MVKKSRKKVIAVISIIFVTLFLIASFGIIFYQKNLLFSPESSIIRSFSNIAPYSNEVISVNLYIDVGAIPEKVVVIEERVPIGVIFVDHVSRDGVLGEDGILRWIIENSAGLSDISVSYNIKFPNIGSYSPFVGNYLFGSKSGGVNPVIGAISGDEVIIVLENPAKPAILDISSTQEDTNIIINEFEEGNAPIIKSVNPGAYEIEAYKPGYIPKSVNTILSPSQVYSYQFNLDALPIISTCYCDSCDSCTQMLRNNSCDQIKLTTSLVMNVGGAKCISEPISNRILDCNGYNISKKTYDGNGYGIYLTSKSDGTKIINCSIYKMGIGVYVNSGKDFDISFVKADSNRNGISLSKTMNTTIYNSYTTNNKNYGLQLMSKVNNSSIIGLTSCSNIKYDIHSNSLTSASYSSVKCRQDKTYRVPAGTCVLSC